jgi:hypothetical protein
MVNTYRREVLFRTRLSPGTLATANTPDITYAELKKLEIETIKEIETTMKLYNAARPPLKKKRTYEQVKERVKELLNKANPSSLLNLMKRERKLVVEGSTPPKGGYNSQKHKNTNITKQPRKPKILTKQPRKPNNK